jgi:CRISPR/Cas system CMR-associated protein Cmr5 small subunit
MKKIVIGFFLVVLIALIVAFILPTTKTITQSVNVTCPIDALTRNMANPVNWSIWWPGKKINDSSFSYNEKTIRINNILLNGFNGATQSDGMQIQVALQALSIDSYTSQINLTTQYQLSNNVLEKIRQYLSLSSSKAAFTNLLNHVQTVFSSIEKTYGFNIERQKVPNSSYISTKKSFDHHPTTDEIYSMINELQQYIAKLESKEMSAPILNIHTDNNKDYDVMVAIATVRDLPSTDKFFLKNMMLGNIMVAKVKGDRKRIDSCIQAMKYYISDYRKSSPAIYFERLITNRLTEKDSTKWVSTINYPIFN